jgi:hypothetical protein
MTQQDPRGIAITPIKVRDLPRFLKAIEPIAAELATGDISGALMRHAEAVIEATTIGSGVERAWLDIQTPDVLAELASRVLGVNADFFVHRVLPVIQDAADRLAQTAFGGTSGSPPSSMPDSAIET